MGELSQHEIDELRKQVYVGVQKYIDTRFQAMNDKIDASQCVVATRLDSMNEWRATIQDRNAMYLPRSEHDIWRQFVDNKLVELNTFKAVIDDKATQKQFNLSTGLAAIAILIGLFDLVKSLIR